jgi:peptidoglycan/LPS O-acetylase OafA/YrhL
VASANRKLELAPRPGSRVLGHAPALDGVRGLAVALIVVYHFAGHYVMHGASISLDVFFALSGFLITALLLDERRVAGRVDLRAFYVRRARRLLPALFLMLAVWCCLLLAFHDQGWMGSTPAGDGAWFSVAVGPALRSVGLALVYVANWDVLSGMGAPLQHLWSLAVEEQFYVVWPSVLLVLLLAGRRTRLALVAAGVVASIVWAHVLWFHGSGPNRLYFGTDTRAASLLTGAFAALVWHRRRVQGRRPRLAAVRAWAAAAVFAVLVFRLPDSWPKYTVIPFLTALFTVQVLPFVVDRPRALLARGLSQRPLVWLGQRSYGLYLWHYLWATWTHGLPLALGMPLGVSGALLCTVLSWTYVERPILSRRRLRVPAPAPAELPGRAVA